MAHTVGLTGNLSSDDADNTKDLYHLLNSGIASYRAEIPEVSEVFPVPAFNSTTPIGTENIVGVNSWSLNFAGRYPRATAKTGAEGLVTYSNGYVLGANAWSLNLTCQEFLATGFSSTPPTVHEYLPGLYSGTGTFDCRIDDTTATSAAGTTGSATFRLCTDTADNTFAGTIAISSAVQQVVVDGLNVARYSFTVDGNLTSAGTNPLLPAGALTRPDITDVLLDVDGTIQYSGEAFLTSLAMNVSVGSPIDITGTARGTGALTRAS